MSNERNPPARSSQGDARSRLGFVLALGLGLGSQSIAAPTEDLPAWRAMDYGPYLTASIEAPEPGTNIAYKGIAINLGANFGGQHNEAVVFDTDLLRYSAAWTGNFVALKGVVFDGEHWAYPQIDGRQLFGNNVSPGWAKDGSFADPREFPFGPLPKEWAQWKGLYLHEKKVVLSYLVDGAQVLEMPSIEQKEGLTAFARTLNIGASMRRQAVQVAFEAQRRVTLLSLEGLKAVDTSTAAGLSLAVIEAANAGPNQEVIAVGVVGAGSNARWVVPDGNIRLQSEANPEPAKLKILIWSGSRERLPEFAAMVRSSSPPVDLKPLTQGGQARWPQKLETRGKAGTGNGPYVIDTLTEPESNPWHSWLRFGGMDFFADGKRAAVCTWNGDVWIVSGVDGDLAKLTWQRIATGLFQPLGLKIVDDQIYVLGRDQITRLQDLNGDGETDFYESFNNQCLTSEHFHEFALDLKLGSDGNFYYIKCACHGVVAQHPHHGTLMKVSRDGSKLEVVARGLRAANGLGAGPNGEFTSIDNQGYWMPANRINWIKPGGWYGNQWAWNPEGRTDYDEPLCWMHNFVDRSGGTQLWVPTDQWGPFRDQVITLSYGMGHMFLLLKEEVEGQMQGAVTRFPLEFETGVMRGAFHPQNGQLYGCGLYGWAGNKTRAGGLYRVRYTGEPVNMANELHFVRDGIVLGFTDPLDPDSATDRGNYDVKAWNYRWTVNYGSPDFKLNGSEGRDDWPVQSATLSADHKRVFLKIPDVQRVMQLHLVFTLKSKAGAELNNFVHGTIHKLDSKVGSEWLGANPISRAEDAQLKLAVEAPGLIQRFRNAESEDTRTARLPALFVPSGSPPTPFIEPGPFNCRAEGFIKVDLNEETTFEATGRGIVKLRINGKEVLATQGGANTQSSPVSLRRGLNRFELDYQSPDAGDAELRLAWSSARQPLEPVPPTVFVHDGADPKLRSQSLVREGRDLFTEHRCVLCHKPASAVAGKSAPEMGYDAPSFNGIGNRLSPQWVAQWLQDPGKLRTDSRMPRLLRGDDVATQAANIAAYLATLREKPSDAAAQASASSSSSDTNLIAAGEKLFSDLGCMACHTLPGDPTLAADTRISIGYVREKWVPQELSQFLRAPSKHFRWTRIPDFNLASSEADAIGAFVISRGEATSSPQGGKPGDAQHGQQLVSSLGCLACHQLENAEDRSKAPSLERLKAADWQNGCLANGEAERREAPDFGFREDQRAALQTFAKEGFPAALNRHTPTEFAERQYANLRCAACHPRDNETDLLTKLTAGQKPPDDDDFSSKSVHVGRPLLTLAGEKLYAGWTLRLLDGSLGYKPRSELQGRMPAFPPYASGLAEGLAHQHGYRMESAPSPKVDTGLAEIGKRLTGVTDGFSCIACHDVGTQKALAGKDTATVNFDCVAERLRPTYYWRYVRDPLRLLPGTMMPKFIGEDGTTPVKTVFNGDSQQQFNAIWNYLGSLRPREGEQSR